MEFDQVNCLLESQNFLNQVFQNRSTYGIFGINQICSALYNFAVSSLIMRNNVKEYLIIFEKNYSTYIIL